ncbi:sugar phosphate permease [Collimonas sp. PA-H2]|uniref:MFS transporter n=1 Tax=Collimonas sp. PA-H2 TaxID=1881062 RepID=UPI000BF63221|nr:MFS transporter [Collimonas sp. PA-H2]PFH11226.1 sugar phosphate permease [Collimonas sp. PA-H2]
MIDTFAIAAGSSALQKKQDLKRYFQFALLLLAAGTIYPMLYLRQNYELTILDAFRISKDELENSYALMGVIYLIAYGPSGWLADKMSARILIPFSLALVGVFGLWFASFPDKQFLPLIFAGWGIGAGLTFWAALIKSVKLLAKRDEQGRFFGILDGGRGLIEAVLATAALSIFAYMMHNSATSRQAMQPIVYMYSISCLLIAVLIFVFLDKRDVDAVSDAARRDKVGLITGLRILLGIPQLWLMAFIILTGYQLFWVTYSFSSFLRQGHGMDAVAAGTITVIKLWMRPIGGIGGGFLGNRFSNENVLAGAMLLAAAGLVGLMILPEYANTYVLLAFVLLIGTMSYTVRGLYWALLDKCQVPAAVIGLAIGVVSMVGYLPDVFLPEINAAVLTKFPGLTGFKVYFGYIALCGVLGAVGVFYFKKSTKKERAQP